MKNSKFLIPLILLLIVILGVFLLRNYKNNGYISLNPNCSENLDEGARFECFSKYFNNLVHAKGAKEALNQLAALMESDPFVNSTCHELTHVIGEEAFKIYGSVTEASKYGNMICYDGYAHGVMESYMTKFSDSELKNLMPDICKLDSSGRLTQGYYDCVHGLGHGVTIRFDNDIFKALPYCDLLKTTFDKNACYNGAFMQNVLVDGVSHKSIDLKDNDPVYPCDAVPTRMKDACYLIQTSHMLQATNNDVSAVFSLCDKVEKNYIKTCYQSMGRDISSLANGIPSKISELCGLGNSSYQGECFAGAAGDLVYRNQKASDGEALCTITPTQYQKLCEAGKNAAASLQ
jgi:hypothetical protein